MIVIYSSTSNSVPPTILCEDNIPLLNFSTKFLKTVKRLLFHNTCWTPSLVVLYLTLNLVKFQWNAANAENSKQASPCSLNIAMWTSLMSWDQKQDIPRSTKAFLAKSQRQPQLLLPDCELYRDDRQGSLLGVWFLSLYSLFCGSCHA